MSSHRSASVRHSGIFNISYQRHALCKPPASERDVAVCAEAASEPMRTEESALSASSAAYSTIATAPTPG